MPCNCPGSGCQCAQASTDSITISGTGSVANPQIHDVNISATAGNQVSIIADGLLVPAWDPCDHLVPQNLVSNGNILIEGEDNCGIDRLIDPPIDSFLGHDLLSGNAGWKPLASTDASNQASIGSDGGVYVAPGSGVFDPCDASDVGTIQTQGNLLIQGGVDCRYERLSSPTTCQLLGDVGGQAGWTTPTFTRASFAASPAAIGLNAPLDGPRVSTSAVAGVLTNAQSCIFSVTIVAQIFITQANSTPSSQMLFDHSGGIYMDRSTTLPVAIGSNAVAFGANGTDITFGLNAQSSITVASFGVRGIAEVTCLLFPGDTVTYFINNGALNNSGMDPASFTVSFDNVTIISQRA